MNVRRGILSIVTIAFLAVVAPNTPLPTPSVSAHEVTTVGGKCISPTSATFNFDAIYMGDGERTIIVYGPNGTSNDVKTNVDGTHTIVVSGFDPQTGTVNFTWWTDAVAPSGMPSIPVDFSKCPPAVPATSSTTTTTTTVVPVTTSSPTPTVATAPPPVPNTPTADSSTTTTTSVASQTPASTTTVAVKPPTSSTPGSTPLLPATGTTPQTDNIVLYAWLFVLAGFACAIIVHIRKPKEEVIQ